MKCLPSAVHLCCLFGNLFLFGNFKKIECVFSLVSVGEEFDDEVGKDCSDGVENDIRHCVHNCPAVGINGREESKLFRRTLCHLDAPVLCVSDAAAHAGNLVKAEFENLPSRCGEEREAEGCEKYEREGSGVAVSFENCADDFVAEENARRTAYEMEHNVPPSEIIVKIEEFAAEGCTPNHGDKEILE